MANFFTSPKDLTRWVKEDNSSYLEASGKIMSAIGTRKNEQDIIETTKKIFANQNMENAAEVLYGILAEYNITEKNIKQAEKQLDIEVAAHALQQAKVITAEEKQQMIKKAQIMRQPGEYPMPLRVCPKLPYSVGKRLISTYNCRHYCLDSITFDDDPERVYCGETLWRKHVMDKFSREWKDPKTGEWVGGYINKRFYVFPDAGTPGNPDVARDHGNRMSLKPWERTRIPRKHEWSIERRLQEQREPDSTKSITLADAITSSPNMIKLSSAEVKTASDDGIVEKIFSETIDLHNSGVSSEDIALSLSEKYSQPIDKVVRIQTIAFQKMSSHQADVYKTAYNTHSPSGFYTLSDSPIKTNKGYLPPGTPLKPHTTVPSESAAQQFMTKGDVFDVYDPQRLQELPVQQVYVDKQVASQLQSWDDIQSGAKDTGLIETPPVIEEEQKLQEEQEPEQTP